MSEDRELLELAAKANWAGELEDMSIRWGDLDNCILYIHADNQDHNGHDREYRWNPLEDDGDALRLAVKLRLEVFTKDEPFDTAAVSRYGMDDIYAEHRADDPYAATRRAIVRAAAQIGKAMP